MRMSYHVKHCSPQCPWCAKRYWKWLAGRMVQMDKPVRGETVSFQAASLNSASRFKQG